jgi:hypothetical protein
MLGFTALLCVDCQFVLSWRVDEFHLHEPIRAKSKISVLGRIDGHGEGDDHIRQTRAGNGD